MLLFILMFYTLVTMCGGNPQGDAFGFRYWREPGAMREYINEGALGRFQGFIACIIGAAFVIAGASIGSALFDLVAENRGA
jgi:amino acid transporter